MSINTYSGFTYGHNITEDNNFINFSEGAGPILAAEIEIGSYSLGEFVDAVLNALNSTGSLTYTGSLDRTTRKITLSGSGIFSLYPVSGDQSEVSAFELMGFTSDLSGLDTYEGDSPSGFFYEPQYWLQQFVDFQDNIKSVSSSVNTSASGLVEAVNWGKIEMMNCNIKYATDILNQMVIKNNANGVADLRAFMNYIINKYTIEFIPDIGNPSNFTKCILESTQESKDGTAFRLKELYAQKLAYYWETGILVFRKTERS